MRHRKVMAWEKRLKSVFDEIDREMEDLYGDRWPLHPSRPDEGSTANPEHDGLFNIGAAFSTGIGLKHGPGYTVDIRISTLKNVPEEILDEIEAKVVQSLETKLLAAFPDRELNVSDDHGLIRIHGDLSLD